MRRARIDPQLSARMVGARALSYTTPGAAGRPPHVRAASGVGYDGNAIYVVQLDASFAAIIEGERVTAVDVSQGPDVLELASCTVIDGELWAFGSGSHVASERIVRLRPDGAAHVREAAPLYASLREALLDRLDFAGVTHTDDRLWFFHRGNRDDDDFAAFACIRLEAWYAWLDGDATSPHVFTRGAFDLGEIEGARVGFTDVDHREQRIYYLAGGPVGGSQLGIIDLRGGEVRATALVTSDGAPIAAAGLAMVSATRAVVTVDPGDPSIPAMLYEVELG